MASVRLTIVVMATLVLLTLATALGHDTDYKGVVDEVDLPPALAEHIDALFLDLSLKAEIGGDDLRVRLEHLFGEYRRTLGTSSPLYHVSLEELLAVEHSWALVRRSLRTAPSTTVVTWLLQSESLQQWKLAAVLLWAMAETKPAAVLAPVLNHLLLRTMGHDSVSLFLPVYQRLLGRLPDRSLPRTAVLVPFYVQFVLPVARPSPSSMPAAMGMVAEPEPGTPVELGRGLDRLWNDLLRCSTTDDVRDVTERARAELPAQSWSILFFDAVLRLCRDDGGRPMDEVVVDDDFRRHLYAEAVRRAYRLGARGGLFPCLKAWIGFRDLIDLDRLGVHDLDFGLVVNWINEFFSVAAGDPRTASSYRGHSLPHLLSHLNVDEITALFDDFLQGDIQSRQDCDDARLQLTLAGSSFESLSASDRYRFRILQDAELLDLLGTFHWTLMRRPDLHRLYIAEPRSARQSFRIVASIAFSLENGDKWWDSDDFLNDHHFSRSTALLMGQIAARTGPFAGEECDALSARTELIRSMIIQGAGLLSTQIDYESVLHDLLPQDDAAADCTDTLGVLARTLETASASKAFSLAARTVRVLQRAPSGPGPARRAALDVLAQLYGRLQPDQQFGLARLYLSGDLSWRLNHPFTECDERRMEKNCDDEPCRFCGQRLPCDRLQDAAIEESALGLLDQYRIPFFFLESDKDPLTRLSCERHLVHAYCIAMAAATASVTNERDSHRSSSSNQSDRLYNCECNGADIGDDQDIDNDDYDVRIAVADDGDSMQNSV